jgi:hypothetical protein
MAVRRLVIAEAGSMRWTTTAGCGSGTRITDCRR